MKKGRPNWRSVRFRERELREDLGKRHTLWLHGGCIGFIVLGVMWAAAHLQFVMGSDSLAIRYLVTLGVGYMAYLLVLRLWAAWLLRDNPADVADVADVADALEAGVDLSTNVIGRVRLPSIRSGGGGDYGGGGASADFSDAAGEGIGNLASGAIEVAAGSDEGAVVVVPVVAVFLVGLAVLFGMGSLMLLYFGTEALLAVAVELAFTYVAARTVVKVARGGWMQTVARLTWKPLLGALACAVLLGGTIDYFIPQAKSLPQAIRLIATST
ncbi:MAG: hypothetical protein KIS62_16110 [Ramlibacter sp.]|nr:hypothetical protein [Ramlibacter sp.]MCW5651273.1 hypothetical protein [Ramlibacter sp.]